MTKQELIKALEWFDDDMPVLVSGFFDITHVDVVRVPTDDGGIIAALSLQITDQ